jgi:hypothetical protein
MVSNTNQENDLSFLEKKDANTLSGKDIFFTVVRNLHWLLLCALICGGIAYYRSDRQDRIYESHAKVRLTSVTRSRLESGISTLENITNRRVAITMNAINDEIIVLRSGNPMLEVASASTWVRPIRTRPSSSSASGTCTVNPRSTSRCWT